MIELQPPQVREYIPAPRTASAAMNGRTTATSRSTTENADFHKRFHLPVSARLSQAKQTLIQLDAPPKLVMNQVPVPDLLLWTQPDVPPPRKRLVPPPPRNTTKPVRSLQTAPTLDLPNREIKMADMQFSPPPVITALPKLAAPPAATTPMKVNGPEQAEQLPQTVSTTSTQETAAHIISLSSLPLRAEAIVAIPAANQTAASGGQEGHEGRQGMRTGEGSEAGKLSTAGNAGSVADVGNTAQMPPGTVGGGGSGASSSGSGSDETVSAAIHKLVLPRDGKFGVVVMGSSAAEAYPDSVGLMTGKVVYTVYLKLGLRKNWILQYCLPGTVEQTFLAKGSATRVDAPWPFLMLRPDLEIGPSVDALILRGMVDTEGHFEKLALVFPNEFPKKELLLSSLRKWEFRPAKRDQQPIAVEVLLIIPGERE
jgi:hypothetical protein